MVTMAEKRYHWLKLKDDFFAQKEIKKLRRIAGGDTYTIIYLKMQLQSIKNGGRLFFEGLEDSFHEELALTIDEDTENVKMTLLFLEKCKLIEELSSEEFLLPEVCSCIGSEGSSAERVRRLRENKKALQCNGNVTISNERVTGVKRVGNVEIEIEKEIEKEIELELDKTIVEKNNVRKQIDERILQYTLHVELQIALQQFVEHRKALKKPIKTLYTLNLLLAELDKHSDKLAVVNQSIANCWQGFFEVKPSGGGKKEEETGNIFRQIGREEGLW
jgi:predicted phage replisome organizer